MNIQAIIFDNKLYDFESTEEWISKNKFKPLRKARMTKNTIKYRIKIPDKEKCYRIKKINEGLKFIFEYDKCLGYKNKSY